MNESVGLLDARERGEDSEPTKLRGRSLRVALAAVVTLGLLAIGHRAVTPGQLEAAAKSGDAGSAEMHSAAVVIDLDEDDSFLEHLRAEDLVGSEPVADHTKLQISPASAINQENAHLAPKYRATQLVSFTINTFGGIESDGECKGYQVGSGGSCYLGNSNNLTKDLERRLQILTKVLDTIRNDHSHEQSAIDHCGGVLKIMMLPEFFLRGPFGAFSTAQIFGDGLLLHVADRVRELISGEEWEHWLFVFGTVIVARSPEHPSLPWEYEVGRGPVVYYNFAPVYKGGSHKHRYLVTKRYVSRIDFLNRTNLPSPTSANITAYGRLSPRMRALLQRRDTRLIEDNVLDIDGIRIGIEICLDHSRGALYENLQKNYNNSLVQVQLITSAGMSIEAGPNPVVPGGVVYLCDGSASSGACMRSIHDHSFDPKRVCRSNGGKMGIKSIPVGQRGYSAFFGLQRCIDFTDRDLLRGYYSLHQPQGCAHTLETYGIDVADDLQDYLPAIEIYPTVKLASAAA